MSSQIQTTFVRNIRLSSLPIVSETHTYTPIKNMNPISYNTSSIKLSKNITEKTLFSPIKNSFLIPLSLSFSNIKPT